MDPRNKSEDDCSECMSEDDKRKSELEYEDRVCAPDDDFALKSSLRGDNRGQVIEKRDNQKIPGIFLQGRKIGMTILLIICRCLDVILRKRGMTIMMWILVSSLTMTNMAHAECTPAPDCVELGYTETSCETTSLKCPFDTSKLYCLPCDSSFKAALTMPDILWGGNTMLILAD